jgi:hypothetical protein
LPCRRYPSTARVSSGNRVRIPSRYSSSIRLLWGVSLMSSTIESKPESRSFSAHRRSSAWMSRRRASASSGVSRGSRQRTTSQARRSPGSGIGTSVRTRTAVGRIRRRRPIRASCPASSAAPVPGIARTSSCRPTAAHARLSWPMVGSPISPRSIRPSCECERPTLPAAVRRLAPASSRAFRISRPISNLTRRVIAPASRRAAVGRGMTGWWRGAVTCELPPSGSPRVPSVEAAMDGLRIRRRLDRQRSHSSAERAIRRAAEEQVRPMERRAFQTGREAESRRAGEAERRGAQRRRGLRRGIG